MHTRRLRIDAAVETEDILRDGRYAGPEGEVDLSAALSTAVRGTVLLGPDDPLPTGRPAGAETSAGASAATGGVGGDGDIGGSMAIEVTDDTSLAAARRLVGEAPDPVLCLNFASATHPGGGFSTGALGQEESLARASGLMACLRAVPRYYEIHHAERDPLYTHHVVYSPAVPVFRDDGGALLPAPYPVTILTAAAPNATELRQAPDRLARIPRLVAERIARVLAVAAAFGHGRLVLGAWGCGAFGNDPNMVADAFAAQLHPRGAFPNAFTRVVFAILPSTVSAPDSPNLAAFRRRFA